MLECFLTRWETTDFHKNLSSWDQLRIEIEILLETVLVEVVLVDTVLEAVPADIVPVVDLGVAALEDVVLVDTVLAAWEVVRVVPEVVLADIPEIASVVRVVLVQVVRVVQVVQVVHVAQVVLADIVPEAVADIVQAEADTVLEVVLAASEDSE